jgi:hypothetical protein
MNKNKSAAGEALNLTQLLAIAERAIEYHNADAVVRAARSDFFDACETCKAEMGISEYVQRGTDTWETLADKTSVERATLQAAKRVRYNATRRLQSAIRLYRKGIV